MLPITGVHMEAGVLTRDLVPHGAFKNTVVDKGHSEYKGVQGRVTSELLS